MKKFFCGLAFVFGLFGAVYAEESHWYYSDDYGLVKAGITYAGMSKEVRLSDFMARTMKELRVNGFPVTELKKLSKFLSWACWKALGEYDIKDDEFYLITISNRISLASSNDEKYMIMVKICDNGKSFYWAGLSYTDED